MRLECPATRSFQIIQHLQPVDLLSRRSKAVPIALKYNFVTEVTSLVVTKPDAGKTKADFISLDKDGSRYADIPPNFSANNDEDKDDFTPDYEADSEAKEKGQCEIRLFSKTYLRGEAKTLTGDTPQLSGDFDDKTTSVEVKGRCCWELFVDAGFGGSSKKFTPGQYKSSADLEAIFRKVSSVKKLDNC